MWFVDAFADEDDAEDDADVEAFADGLADAALAIAVPPPTRTPETASVIASFLSRCCIPITSFPLLVSTLSQAGRAEGRLGPGRDVAEDLGAGACGQPAASCSMRTVSTVSASSARLSSR